MRSAARSSSPRGGSSTAMSRKLWRESHKRSSIRGLPVVCGGSKGLVGGAGTSAVDANLLQDRRPPTAPGQQLGQAERVDVSLGAHGVDGQELPPRPAVQVLVLRVVSL